MLSKKQVFRRFAVLSMLLLAVLAGVQAAAAQQEQIFGSTDGAISIHAQAGWVATNLPANATVISGVAVAQDQTVLDTAMRSYNSGIVMATAPGSYAIVTIISPAVWTMYSGDPAQALQLALQGIYQQASINPTTKLTVNNSISTTIGGYPAQIYDVSSTQQINTRGYLGGLVAGNTIALVEAFTSPISAFDSNVQVLQGLLSTVRLPAESGAVTPPIYGAEPTALPVQTLSVQTLPTLPAAGLPTQAAVGGLPTPVAPVASPVAATGGEMTTYRSAGDKLSMTLPAGWVFVDQIADKNAVAFGDSQAAAQSRLDSVIPPAAGTAPVALIGTGGVIVLYPMANFNVDPTAPNLAPLMDQVLNGLKANGYKTFGDPQPIAAGTGQGVLAGINGAEIGFLALVPFGDQIAYMTSTTTGSIQAFAADQALQVQLASIVDTVRVPAEQPTPVATTTGGLGGLQPAGSPVPPTTGGLGGLGTAPTEAPSTGGLGGLGAAATEAAAPSTGGLGGLAAAPAASPTP